MSANLLPELVLEGCTPTPLAGYLKALGVLRLLGEQKPEWSVRGAWREDRFVLRSAVFSGGADAKRLMVQEFFLDEYRPTPLVAPWNGGSGFFPNDNHAGIEAIANGRAARFAAYREVIAFCHEVVKGHELKESPKNESKAAFLTAVRASGPEALLPWMDAAVLLGGDEPRYPPLLGTGGNDGRLDFTNNFMQRVSELFNPSTGEASGSARSLLPSALFGVATSGLTGAAIGQFHPGGVGGPNAGTGYEAGSLMNPWDFVFMLEGALLFAAAATRRLEAAEPGMLAYPFTVRSSGAGNGAVGLGDETQARAEIWLPLWKQFASFTEIKAILTEGRVAIGRRPVRDGLGFVRAVAGLGVDRGITSFQRYGFLMRSGKAYLATPLNRVAVCRNPNADLITELESGQFLDRLRRFGRDDQTPARIRSQVRQLEDALFEMAQRPEPRALQAMIVHLGALSHLLGKSRKGREAVPPVPTLSQNWVLKADDGSIEFRIAATLAGLHGGMPLRPFFVPVAQDDYGNWKWQPESRLAVWGEGGFATNLGHVIARRRLEGERLGWDDSPFQFRAGATAGDVAAWLSGELNETRLTALLLGLAHACIPAHLASRGNPSALPAAYCVLKPFFTPHSLLTHLHLLAPDRSLPLPGELVAKLQAGRMQEAVALAWRRLRIANFPVPTSPKQAPSAPHLDGLRFLTALAIPLETAELARCLTAFASRPSFETA